MPDIPLAADETSMITPSLKETLHRLEVLTQYVKAEQESRKMTRNNVVSTDLRSRNVRVKREDKNELTLGDIRDFIDRCDELSMPNDSKVRMDTLLDLFQKGGTPAFAITASCSDDFNKYVTLNRDTLDAAERAGIL